MKTTTKLLTAIFLATGLTATALPSFAQAQGGGKMDRSEMREKMREKRAEHMQQHQAKLHDALKLTPEQEAGWKKYTASMQPPPKPEGNREEWSKLTAPERADKMLEHSKQHQERMTEHVAALKTFYATLTPEQKKTMDGFHHGGHHGGRRGQQQGDGAAPAPKQ